MIRIGYCRAKKCNLRGFRVEGHTTSGIHQLLRMHNVDKHNNSMVQIRNYIDGSSLLI